MENIFSRQGPPAGTQAMPRTFIANVFSYMFLALAISGVVSWLFVSFPEQLLFGVLIGETGFTPLGYIIMFAPIGIVLFMQFRFEKLSVQTLFLMLVLYAALIGASLSFIFLIYSASSITLTFFISAGTFGAMAFLGYTTRTDLTKFGGIMYMLFIGIFIASIANMIMGSETLDWIISFVGIFVFTGLTAYMMQQLKYMSHYVGAHTVQGQKLAIWGGLQLYILFINIFLTLLRFFGDRD